MLGFNDLLSALLGAGLALLGGYALDSIGVAALAHRRDRDRRRARPVAAAARARGDASAGRLTYSPSAVARRAAAERCTASDGRGGVRPLEQSAYGQQAAARQGAARDPECVFQSRTERAVAFVQPRGPEQVPGQPRCRAAQIRRRRDAPLQRRAGVRRVDRLARGEEGTPEEPQRLRRRILLGGRVSPMAASPPTRPTGSTRARRDFRRRTGRRAAAGCSQAVRSRRPPRPARSTPQRGRARRSRRPDAAVRDRGGSLARDTDELEHLAQLGPARPEGGHQLVARFRAVLHDEVARVRLQEMGDRRRLAQRPGEPAPAQRRLLEQRGHGSKSVPRRTARPNHSAACRSNEWLSSASVSSRVIRGSCRPAARAARPNKAFDVARRRGGSPPPSTAGPGRSSWP